METNIIKGWEESIISIYAEIIKVKGTEGKAPYLEIGDIDINSKTYILKDKHSVRGCKLSIENDIVISRVRPTRGAIALIKDKEINVSSAFTILRLNSKVEAKTVFYQLAFNNSFLNYLGDNCTGTLYPTVSEENIVNFKINIPPLSEQHRIVARLDALMQKVESNKQRIEKIPKLLKRFRQSVLALSISGILTEEWRTTHKITEEWKEINLGSVASLITSGSRGWAKYYAESGSTFVRAQNISKDLLDLSDIAFVKLPNKAEGIRTLINEGDILVTITGANVAKTAHVDFNIKDAYVSQHVCLVRLKKNILSKYIYLFLISESYGRKQLLSSAYGQGKPQLNLDNIKNVEIPIPSPNEQKEIVRRVEHLFAFADKIEARYTKAKAMLDKLPQSILAIAFRGELVPQDSNDEPASNLLERIKVEKLKLLKEKKVKKRIVSVKSIEKKATNFKDILSYLQSIRKPVTQSEILNSVNIDASSYLIQLNDLIDKDILIKKHLDSQIFYELKK